MDSDAPGIRKAPSDREVRRSLRSLVLTLVRLLVLLGIAAGAALKGFDYLSPASASPLRSLNARAPAAVPLGAPAIYLDAVPGLTAVVTKAVLSPSALSIDLNITVARADELKRNELTVSVWNAFTANHPGGWHVDNALFGPATITVHVPAGLSRPYITQLPDLWLTGCDCYEYEAPYLLAQGLGGGPAPVTQEPPGSTPSPGPGYVPAVIEQDVLDLSSAAIGGSVFTLSSSSYPPAEQTGPATWVWQDFDQREPVYFEAESVSGKDQADQQTFLAGLLLGIAGSALIVVVDHGFDHRDIWSDLRDYRDKVRRRRRSRRAT